MPRFFLLTTDIRATFRRKIDGFVDFDRWRDAKRSPSEWPTGSAGRKAPHGAGIRAPEHHSEATEAMLAHIPGLRVVIPSAPERAYGLLLAAIRDPDPVVFLEPTRIYRAVKGEVEDNGEALPLDLAFVIREGRDVTLISWGAPCCSAIWLRKTSALM